MINLFQAILKIYPQVTHSIGDKAFDVEGNHVAYDKDAVLAYVDAHAYIEKRAREYPPLTDWLDGMVKGDQAQMDKYIADCQAVKQKYPKGQV